MKDIQQLIKKENNQEYKDIYPKTFTDAVLDKHTGANLADILNSFNMYFIAYAGSKEVTRVQVPTNLRRKGLWITYIMLDDTIVTEYYNGSLLTDDAWQDSANWVNSMQPFDKFSKKNMTCRFDGFTDKSTSSKLMTVKQEGEIVFSTTDNRFYYLHRDVLYAYWEVKGKPSNTEFQYKDSVYTDKLFLCKDRAYVMYNGTLVDIARFTIDKELSLTSNNPIANSTVTKKINEVNADATTALTLARELKEEGRFQINGNVTNNPDEEDITVEENKLKFKDKVYNAGEFSGLGRVYLRKNIVNGKNVLTQEMINKSNTIYIIQYDYDLDNEEINIPENCTLDFQGGSLKNGIIVLNNTLISANLYQIFYNITTKGYSPSECQVEWFGAKSYSRIDTNFTYSSDAIQDALNSCFSNIYFNVGIYYIDKTLEMSYYKTLNFKGAQNWTVKTVYNYPIDNINASTLCALTDIDVLHIKCECNKVPNDIDSTIKILGYGVIDLTKVINYSKSAVKIIIKNVNVTGNIIHLHIINNISRFTTLQQVEEVAKNDYGTSIGIELVNNSTQDGLSIYSTEIDGIIKGFRYGIKNNIPNRCFPTAFVFKCAISQCITAIDFGESSIMGSYVVCNHIQSYKAFSLSNYNDYPLFIGKITNIYFDTYIWDLGLEFNNIYMHNNIMNLNIEDTPIFSDNFRQFKLHINGNFLSKYNYNKNFDLISSEISFKRYSDYYIDFLTNDYAFHKDYILENDNNIKINGNPFNCINRGFNIKPKIEDNEKSFSLKFNIIQYVGITKIFIEYTSSKFTSYFDNVDIIYYNNENKILINNNYKLKQEKIDNNSAILSDINIRYGNNVHHVEIKFNNLNYINDDAIYINIKAMGFRHNYHHINTPQRTIINNDGIFSLHGHKFRSVSNENQTYLENQSNGGKFYSTAGQPRYFRDEDIINAVKASPNAYGNGAQFYKYTFKEGSLVIYDKTNDKYFELKGSILGKAVSGSINTKPNTVPEGYFYLAKDEKSDGKIEYKPLYAKENGEYIDSLGNPANASKKGTTAQRPTGVQIGFTYKDIDLNKWIIWNGEAWENIDGTALG